MKTLLKFYWTEASRFLRSCLFVITLSLLFMGSAAAAPPITIGDTCNNSANPDNPLQIINAKVGRDINETIGLNRTSSSSADNFFWKLTPAPPGCNSSNPSCDLGGVTVQLPAGSPGTSVPASTSTTVSGTPPNDTDREFTLRVTEDLAAGTPFICSRKYKLNFEQISWPPHRGVPDTNPANAYQPPKIDGSVENDFGWTGAYRATYSDGADPAPAAIQTLKHNSQPFLYFSAEIKNDPTFDNDDLVVLNFRPSDAATASPTDDIKIFIYPLTSGSSAATDVSARQVTVWKDSTHWTPITSPTDLEVKVSYGGTGSSKNWNVEVQVPTTGTVWGGPDFADDFLFYANILRVDSTGTKPIAAQFRWPRNAPEIAEFPTIPVDEYAFFPAEWGNATKSNTAPMKGVSLSANDIGTKNPQPHQINLTGKNTFFAKVKNDSEVGGVAQLAEKVKVRFRIANWGITSSDNWTDIPAANNPTSPQDVPAGGTQEFTLDWTVAPDLQQKYKDRPHQCMLVELDSLAGTNIVTKSVVRNMDFVSASSFSRQAEISAKGYPLPAGMAKQKFSIYVSKQQEDPLRFARLSEQPFELAVSPDSRRRKDDRVSYLTWSAYGYRHLGQYITINEHKYEVVEPVGSFGYIVRHVGGAVQNWNDQIIGAEKVGKNLYQLTIPKDGTATITTKIDAREYGLINWLVWLLAFLILLLLVILYLIKTGQLGGNTNATQSSSPEQPTSDAGDAASSSTETPTSDGSDSPD